MAGLGRLSVISMRLFRNMKKKGVVSGILEGDAFCTTLWNVNVMICLTLDIKVNLTLGKGAVMGK